MIYPIILCGGSGTRLWPLSRKSYPKQFSKIVGDKTLFQMTCERFSGVAFASPTIVTNDIFRFTVLDELSETSIDARQIILEPAARNTAPAVLAAIVEIYAQDPNATILVLPSDHFISDLGAFKNAVSLAAKSTDKIVTFGVKPTHPETGYGYLETDEANLSIDTIYELVGFVEKPDLTRAEEMLDSGKFLWNGGVFLAPAKLLLEAYEKFQPDMIATVKEAIAKATIDLAFLRPDADTWLACEDISIDYAIMENADNLAVVPVDSGWNDLGDWKAVWSVSEKNSSGVAMTGDAFEIDCHDTLLRSEKKDIALVGIGLENIFAVAMNDAVVVGTMDRAQDVKKAVTMLKTNDVKQADQFPKDHRPWGWYETLALGRRFQVKRIVVKPGASLSLQSHVHRAEHWTVVEGTARVTVDNDIKLLCENQSVYIPLGAVHRMENPGKIPLTLIEVQSGSYLKEDDIIRYEDQFGRS